MQKDKEYRFLNQRNRIRYASNGRLDGLKSRFDAKEKRDISVPLAIEAGTPLFHPLG
jgi:hypothetical protein